MSSRIGSLLLVVSIGCHSSDSTVTPGQDDGPRITVDSLTPKELEFLKPAARKLWQSIEDRTLGESRASDFRDALSTADSTQDRFDERMYEFKLNSGEIEGTRVLMVVVNMKSGKFVAVQTGVWLE